MAYQARGRDPLFDSDMQAAIERRGKELAGVLLMALGGLMMLAFWSYSPDDPSWMSATDAPVQNWIGRLGAGLAAPVFMIVGLGGWALAFITFAWGLRFATHNGEDRLVSRLIFAPVWIAAISLFAATLTPGDTWSHSFNLGGLFGDTVLAALMGVTSVDSSFGLTTLSTVVGGGVILLALFVLGFTRWELIYLVRYAIYLVVLAYVWIMRGSAQAVQGAWGAAHAMRERKRARDERRRAEAAEVAALRAAAAAVPAPRRVSRPVAPQDIEVEEDRYFSDDELPEPRAGFMARLGGAVRTAKESAMRAGPALAARSSGRAADAVIYDDAPDYAPQPAPRAAQPAPRAAAPAPAQPPVAAQRRPEPAQPVAARRPDTAPAPAQVSAQPQARRTAVVRPDAAPAPAAAPAPTQQRPLVATRPTGAAAPMAQDVEDDEDLVQQEQELHRLRRQLADEEAGRGAPLGIGLLSRLPGMIRRGDRSAASAPVAQTPEASMMDEPPADERIKAKIADVVRARARTGQRVVSPAHQPVTKGRGRGPDPLILGARGEPPLSAPAQPRVATEPPLTAAPQQRAPRPAEQPVAQPRAVQPQAQPAPQPRAAQPAAPQARPAQPAPQVRAAQPAPVAAPQARPAQPAPQVAPQVQRQAPVARQAPAPSPVEIEVEVEDDRYSFEAEDSYETLPLEEAEAPTHLPSAEPRRVVQTPARKAPQLSTRARAEAQPALKFDEPAVEYELPPLNLLANPANITRHHLSDEALEENARMLENVLDDYGVKGEIVSVRPGPVVTMYELEPAPGLKASRVIGLADDIARSMSALSARVSTVPGRSVIGIELPNENREKVVLREILAARDFGDSHMKLPLALGKDIGGDPIVANLAKMPHLLIAGTTGSGKSVAINTMILSLLYRLTPEECRLIMIDPKMLELSVYDGIPHLLSPVVTDPKKAVVALKWVVGEMEDRYRKMSKMGVRNIDGYNGRVEDALGKGEMFSRTVQTGFDDDTGEPVFETEEIQPEKMPYIVVIVDEMADLMMVAGKEIEACIQRLAQMARASGIHLIMATQRPSVDVITGTIKANFPTRISFQVTSKIDSRTILGEMGAEQLLGMGDMLYMAGGARITRCHGPFVSDEEVEEIVTFLKGFGPPSYVGGVIEGPDEDKESDIDLVLGLGGNTDGEDALYDQAVAVVIKDRKCSTSYIQRKLGIGYNKAARLVEQMEEEGLVSAANHVGKREILVPEQQ